MISALVTELLVLGYWLPGSCNHVSESQRCGRDSQGGKEWLKRIRSQQRALETPRWKPNRVRNEKRCGFWACRLQVLPNYVPRKGIRTLPDPCN